MQDRESPTRAEALIDRYFGDDAGEVRLAPGDVLMQQGEPNTRLYVVRDGLVTGTIETDDGQIKEIMRASEGDLVGVQSFFTGSFCAGQTVTALRQTVLAYVDRDVPIEPGAPSLERALMPLIVAELLRRQQKVLELAEQERETAERVERMERMSALGQLASGVAHELNNALTVLVRGTSWIARIVQARVDAQEKVFHRAFDAGLAHGRSASAAQVRKRTDELRKQFKLPYATARKVAATGLSDGQLASFVELRDHADRVLELWELGATIHDMRLASEQAEHVVTSMRDLGSQRIDTQTPVDINETIRIALKMLRGMLDAIDVQTDFGELPELRGSRGKLVQVWTNLIKNACEAMTAHGRARDAGTVLRVATRSDATHVTVTIEDSGPGIPAHVLPRIFEPSFTTKKSGLSFGLGLGLSIVQRLVSEHGGDIAAANTATGARFTVRLPRELSAAEPPGSSATPGSSQTPANPPRA